MTNCQATNPPHGHGRRAGGTREGSKKKCTTTPGAEQHLSETLQAADSWHQRWEEGVKAARALEAELQSVQASVSGTASSSTDELARMRTELEAAHKAAAAQASKAQAAVELKGRQGELAVATERMRGLLVSEAEAAHAAQLQLQNALSEARASAAKQTQELSLQQSGKSNLLDEVNALKSEAKDLTDAHSREVERLQERLGALEKAHDALDVALQEEEGGFEERMKGKKEGEGRRPR